MSEQRAEILRRIKKALGHKKPASVEIAAADLEGRLPEEIPRPQWQADRLTRFCERLEAAAGSYTRVNTMGDVPLAAQDYLSSCDRNDHAVGIAPHPLLAEMSWPESIGVESDFNQATDWGAAIAVGYMGIAETGSIVMPSGPTRPTTLNFLPDRHIVVLTIEDIADYMEEVWDRLLSEGAMPRTVNVITGPSRTADVEQTLQLGAHGPRSLHVILVG